MKILKHNHHVISHYDKHLYKYIKKKQYLLLKYTKSYHF